ncbi:hypothetical protein ACLOJK_018474 [Asimina triloba]
MRISPLKKEPKIKHPTHLLSRIFWAPKTLDSRQCKIRHRMKLASSDYDDFLGYEALYDKLSHLFFVQSSSPPVRRDDEASHGENRIDPTEKEPAHGQRTVSVLEQEIKEYEKREKKLEHEVTILQLKVRELEAKDTSHLACRVEAQCLRREKEAAEALVAAYKEQLVLANELIVLRAPSQGCSKKRRSEGPEEGGDEASNSKRRKP